MLSPFLGAVTSPSPVEHARLAAENPPQFSPLRYNFYREPYALEPASCIRKSRIRTASCLGAGHQLFLGCRTVSRRV